jgi:hypothetical protein
MVITGICCEGGSIAGERRVVPVLTADSALLSDLEDVIANDPEVRQARNTVEAARVRLVASMSSMEDMDLMEAQAMFDALNEALVYAADAEDRVLQHYALLTAAEARKRAATRRPATAPRFAPQFAAQLEPRLASRLEPQSASQPILPQRAELEPEGPAPEAPEPEPYPEVGVSAGSAGVVPAPRTWLLAAALAAALMFALTGVLGAELARRLSIRLLRPR